MEYIRRIVDKELDVLVKAFGAISIVGPRGCGKSRTAMERCNTLIDFKKKAAYLSTVECAPQLLLENKTPILFDEWEDATKIWGTIRKECDDNDHFGDYFLTRSTNKELNTTHSGIGRIAEVEMLPMSLYELGFSNGSISLKELFDNPDMMIASRNNIDFKDLIEIACVGGWPENLKKKNKLKY